MLTLITVKRYKAFGKGKLKPGAISETQIKVEGERAAIKKTSLDDYEGEKLEIRPITVLLGANSIGKTSLLDLVLALQQTSMYGDASQSRTSAIRLNGKIVSLGESQSLFHLNKTDQHMGLTFEIDNSRCFETYSSDFRKVLQETLEFTESFFAVAGKKIEAQVLASAASLPTSEMVDLNTTYSKMLRDDPELSQLLAKAAPTPGRKRPLYAETDLSISAKLIDALLGVDLTSTPTMLDLCFAFDRERKNLFVKSYSVFVGERKVLSFGYGKKWNEAGDKNLIDLSSQLIQSNELANYEKSLEKMLQPDMPIFRFGSKGDQERPSIYFVELCWQIVRSTIAELEKSFTANSIAHIDADRGAPKRYYFADPANEESGQKAGFISVLQEDEVVREAVGTWMKTFSLKIEVKPLADMLHRVLVEQGGLELGLDITDVGFGVSQVLPIIVKGFSAPPDSLTLVEQPEAHLHPKMQAELADLFLVMAGLAADSPRGGVIVSPPLTALKRRFIIETHSEYLLKRLRLRIAEGKVKPDDVAIYFLSRSKEGDTVLRRTEVSSDGNFEWPEEFYATDLQDNIDFLKARSARFREQSGDRERASEGS